MKYISKFLKHPIFTGSFLMICGSMLVNVINLIYQVVMGNILGPIGYGTLLSLYSILYILSIVPISSSVAIVKFISGAKSPKERSQVYEGVKKFVFWLAFISSIIVILLSPFIADFLNIDDVVSVILTAGVLFFSLVTLVNQASMQGILKFFGVVGPNFVTSVVKLILGVILIAMGLWVRGAMLAVVIGVALAYLLSTKLVQGKFTHTSKEKFKLKPFLTYSGPVLLQALAFTSLFTTDVILVKHFMSPYDAGLYAALSTLGKIVYFAASPVAQVMFPHVSTRHAKGEKYKEILITSVALTALVAFGIAVVYWVIPHLVLGLLYKQYLAAKDDLVWMGLFIAFYTVANLLVNFALSINKTRIVLVPVIIAILQIILIWFYHNSILQILQISLVLMVCLFFILGSYLSYNQLNAKK